MPPRTLVLFINVLIVSACGLVYELLTGTLASYVLGDSVTQFSLVIGIYLASMGVGAGLTRYFEDNLEKRFVDIELAIALIGGLSAPLLSLCFSYGRYFHGPLYATLFTIGVLVGMELPLLMRILRERFEFKELVSRVMLFDYAGALLASICFPLLLVPRLGLVRTSLLFGLLNAAVGLWALQVLGPQIVRGVRSLRLRAWGVIAVLSCALFYSNKITTLAEDGQFADEIVLAKSSPYQRIIVTRGRSGFQLFLNGHLQFSSADEYRYHEALVHPALMQQTNPKRVLVLGGGDGLALREILKYPSIEHITLVDLDPEMTRLSEHFPPLAELNGHAFGDKRVEVVHADAMAWLDGGGRDLKDQKDPRELYDAAIVDFPDPNSFSVGKLYTTRFYKLLRTRLSPDASVAVQGTSPLFARHSYWCIVATMEAAGFQVKPYQATVPSFGVWGFCLASMKPLKAPSLAAHDDVAAKLRFLNPQTLSGLFDFNADTSRVPVEINRLDNQALVRYYEGEWRKWE